MSYDLMVFYPIAAKAGWSLSRALLFCRHAVNPHLKMEMWTLGTRNADSPFDCVQGNDKRESNSKDEYRGLSAPPFDGLRAPVEMTNLWRGDAGLSTTVHDEAVNLRSR